jgi:cobalt-zinc-cadmium efflux system outer membrane protein
MLPISRRRSVGTIGLVFLAVAAPAWAQPSSLPGTNPARVLTLEQSVAWALENNPDLAVYRQQRGIARAATVIARTYPYNPLVEATVMGDGGPESAGITNRVANVVTLTQVLEFPFQGRIRRDLANATLSRTEWDIAAHEQQLAVQTIRAFQSFVYQQEKLRVLADTLRLQEQTAKDVKNLVDQGLKLKTADFLLAQSDALEARSQYGARQTQAVQAWHALRKLMGVHDDIVEVQGKLASTAPAAGPDQWQERALTERPDLHALDMAYVEAEQRERFEIANRFGAPRIGLKTEYNETSVFFLGGSLQLPLPFFNTKRGEILQRQAEKTKALLDKQRIELQIKQDVAAATNRLNEAKKWVRSLEVEILPNLLKTREDFNKLFAQGEIDVSRLIDMRRRYLRARDSHLDALWELNQARADLAAAIGDFLVATDPPQTTKLGPPTAE